MPQAVSPEGLEPWGNENAKRLSTAQRFRNYLQKTWQMLVTATRNQKPEGSHTLASRMLPGLIASSLQLDLQTGPSHYDAQGKLIWLLATLVLSPSTRKMQLLLKRYFKFWICFNVSKQILGFMSCWHPSLDWGCLFGATELKTSFWCLQCHTNTTLSSNSTKSL